MCLHFQLYSIHGLTYRVFVEKLLFIEITEERSIKYYQDPDSAIQTLQINTRLDRPYIEDKLGQIGLGYKRFRWLLR